MSNEKMSFKERIEDAKELGYGYGVNDLNFPKDTYRVLGSLLYDRIEGRQASNVYLYAVFENAYHEGKRDRTKVVSICAQDRPRFEMSYIRKAFETGRSWRRKSKDMAFIYDEKFSELMGQITLEAEKNWKWIEEIDTAMLDAWIAGFRYEGEETYGDDYSPKPRKIIACDRMRQLKRMYDLGDEPEGDEPYEKALSSFLEAAEKLERTGHGDLIGCLSCPGAWRGMGEESDERSGYSSCHRNCGEICKYIGLVCAKEKKELTEYYIVSEDEYWPLEEDLERYIDW
ncbi:MAG: hypothetical protein IKW90_14745 [Lachnospiraceae bacterium]|nr:hypothetical protein [Lachnospiraceae bacterium]